MPAVISLAPVGGTAVAEEAVGIRIGIQPQGLDAGQARIGEPRDDIAFEIELVAAGLAVRKEAFVRFVRFRETAEELCAPEVAAVFIDRAERIARSLQLALFFHIPAHRDAPREKPVVAPDA